MASNWIAATEAFGTLAVAAAAIWGEALRSKLLPPKLRVELSDNTGQLVPQTVLSPDGAFGGKQPAQKSVEARYYHLRLSNEKAFAVSRSAAMQMTGHKTEAIYRRYAITDSAMLQEAATKLSALHATEGLNRASA